MSRPRLRRAATVPALVALAAAAPAAPVGAQSARAWRHCFTSGVLSCTDVALATAPILDLGARVGTLVDVTVRFDGGAAVAGLLGLGFDYFSPLGPPALAGATAADPAAGYALTPAALGGAPVPFPALGWRAWGQSSAADPAGTRWGLENREYTPEGGFPTRTQLIGGCGLGAYGEIDAQWRTTAATCLPGAAYHFTVATAAWLDADRVRGVTADVYGRLPGEALGASAYCAAYADGAPSFGTDGTRDADGLPAAGDVCRLTALAPVSTVPEPASLALVAAGALAVGTARRGVSGFRGRLPTQG